MVNERELFHDIAGDWSDWAGLGGLSAVLSPTGSPRRNMFLHGITSYGALQALHYLPPNGRIIDLGCGNGRLSRLFASCGRRVLGTEITPEMLIDARKECSHLNCEFVLTDGVLLPVDDASIDGLWCCGVLRYSLFAPNPAYAAIAREMMRALKPGAFVVNCEMYVDVGPDAFLPDVEAAGFKTRSVKVLHRYGRRLESLAAWRALPLSWVKHSAMLSALLRSTFDAACRNTPGLRDYLFVWQKPESA